MPKCVNKREQRIGESKINNQGLKMTIVAYTNSSDMAVMFDDGYVKKCDYRWFKRGVVSNPNFSSSSLLDRTGETNVNRQGLKMTIVAYRAGRDIDVQFEDGAVSSHRHYTDFIKGLIRHPTTAKVPHDLSRVGMSTTNHQGLKMTIVAYVGSQDVDVQFEDGSIIRHQTYANFIKGNTSNPNYHSPRLRADRIGESNIANNGMRMTIIEYKHTDDITVQFEDGTIKSGVRYGSFKKGEVYPGKVNRVGKEICANCGIKMKISEYLRSDNISVIFETGAIKSNMAYSNFISGNIKHPFPYQIGNITMRSPAYIYNGEGNFYCFCNKCKKSDIMTIDEMKSHICNI